LLALRRIDLVQRQVRPARLAEIGAEIFPRERQTSEALRTLVKADAEKWWPMIKEFGIRVK
jgi:hypothetical protein